MKKFKIFIFSLVLVGTLQAQSAHKHLMEGNAAYTEKDYNSAAENYYKALEKDPSSVKGKFNLGNATYQKEGFEEAIKHYSSAVELAQDETVKADAFYNLGNAYLEHSKSSEEQRGENLGKSVDAFKNSLRLNPKDFASKKNLAIAQRMIKQMQQQQQQQQQEQQDQQQKDQQQENNDQQQQQQGQEQQQQQEQQQKQDQAQPKNLSKEEAMQLLKIMDEEEKKVQEKLRKAKSSNKKVEKDW